LISNPRFGPAKTIRGFFASVFAISIGAMLMGLGWELGALVGIFAMAGDLFSSFLIRRLRLASSIMGRGSRSDPEAFFPLLGAWLMLPLSIFEMVVGVTMVGCAAPVANPSQVECL
jgi:hypothetical protein